MLVVQQMDGDDRFFCLAPLHLPRCLHDCCMVFTAVRGSGKHVEQPRVRLTRLHGCRTVVGNCIVGGCTHTPVFSRLSVDTCISCVESHVMSMWGGYGQSDNKRPATHYLCSPQSTSRQATMSTAGWPEGPWQWVELVALSTVCTTACSSICVCIYVYTAMYEHVRSQDVQGHVQARCHDRT